MPDDLTTSNTLTDSVVLAYSGWQVWDGQYWPVRVGGTVIASVEFVQRSPLEAAQLGDKPQIRHLGSNNYRATAHVLNATGAVVIDLGMLKAVRWIRPGEDSGGFAKGDTFSFDVSLALNGWPRADWTSRTAEQYGTQHQWKVNRIVRLTDGLDDATDIEAAEIGIVGDGNQYCLLYCTPVDAQPDPTGL